ncbi:MAG: hypothetical protein GXO39_04270 [Thermotogae bacterium]|nr:hypothetical protein [Thermotogota bacterium]
MEVRRAAIEGVDSVNTSLIDAIKSKLQGMFPYREGDYEIRLKELKVPEAPEITPLELKKAVLQKKTISVPFRGTLQLVDTKRGKVIDEKKGVILRLPVFTPTMTMVVDGTEYTVFNQARMRPGVYARFKRSGEPEVQFNLAKGENFSIELDPAKQEIYVVRKKGGRIPIVSVLRALGLSDSEISTLLGREIAEKNFAKADRFKKDFSDFVEGLADTKLDPNTTRITLGKPFEKVEPETIKLAVKKLLALSRGEVEEDDRNALVFKEVIPAEKLLAEALEKRSRQMFRKAIRNRKFGGGFNLTRAVEDFVTTSSLTSNPEYNNPVELAETLTKITFMGEGGIGSVHGIPEEIRDVSPTYLGFIDPIRTSESEKAGVDLRLSYTTFFGEDGYPRNYFINAKTGKPELKSPLDLWDKKVGFRKDSKVVVHRGKLVKGKPDYYLPDPIMQYTITTGLIPFLNTDHGNRAQMAAKMFTQAVPLKYREAPLVRPEETATGMPISTPYELVKNHLLSIRAEEDAEVVAVTDSHITLKTKSGKKKKIPLFKEFPLARKTFLHYEPAVKKGQKLKAGDLIAYSNFATPDGEPALGVNLRVAIMPYHGLNNEDGFVISESAAKKLTSLHSYRVDFDFDDKQHVVGKEKFKSYFPTLFTSEQLEKLDSNGIVKKGVRLKKGDPIFVALKKASPKPEDVILGRLSKSLVKGFDAEYETWEKDVEGEVREVFFDGKNLRVVIFTEEPAKKGDKLTITHGGKGTITKVLPDDQMPKTKDGKPVDAIFTPLSIPSRINLGQIYEMMAAKAAQKRGKPVKIPAFGYLNENTWEKVKKDFMERYGVKDTEKIYDPDDGREKEVLVGPLYVLKLNKLTDFNFSARSEEGEYDVDLRPAKGGEEGAKAIGSMEFYALVSHNVRDLLREMATFKATKSEDFWKALYLGKPLPALKPPFATEKFYAMLKGAGINVEKKGDELQLLPLTDKDVLSISRGKVERASKLRFDLTPEKGGLFDPAITGGLSGERWAHIELEEPIVNPVFEDVVEQFVPGFKKMPFRKVEEQLRSMKVDELLQKEEDPNKKRILRSLKQHGFKTLADAYVLRRIPVIPPRYRPIIPRPDGSLLVHDANYLYTDVLLANEALRDLKKEGLPDELMQEEREALYESVKALFGLADPRSPYGKARGIKGLIAHVVGQGKTPKESYFQSKVVKKLQAPAARATLSTRDDLHIDEAAVPESMLWKLYHPHIIRELRRRGFPVHQAKKMVEEKDPRAQEVLDKLTKEVPIIINRAPSLWKYNLVALWPRKVSDKEKAVSINMLIAKGLAGDLDGDTVNVHVPITPQAVEDAKRMFPSRIAPHLRRRDDLIYNISHEALIGLNLASIPRGKPVRFRTYEEFKEALMQRKIDWDTPVVIG